MIHDFLPVCREDMEKRGWEQCDFVYVSGDAYVDHPSFGPAIISRVLESFGYKVGIIAQPDWKNKDSITILGEPRLGFLVSAGNMDSMVNHYTVNKKRRHSDAFSPGGVMGLRPDYATIVYCNLIKQVYKSTPIILGGIEASLRRMSHYDYWSDKVKHSVLIDSGADIISYGMGEHSIVEIADALNAGIDVKDITYINGTVYKTKTLDNLSDYINLPSYDEIVKDKRIYAESFYTQYKNTDPFTAKILVEKAKEKLYVVQNPPAKPLTTMEMDDVYALPYMRDYHPMYKADGGIPALSEIKFSITSNRGCFGGCSFCALTFHQGRIIQVRSHESIVDEAVTMTKDRDFKGYIHDVGGPTANFRHTSCEKQLTKSLGPILTRPLNASEQELMQNYVNRGYKLFVSRCAEGRKMSTEAIEKVAEGRVWTGAMAKDLGLVDELGGIDKALNAAATQAGIENYSIIGYPEKENIFASLLGNQKKHYVNSEIKEYLGSYYNSFKALENIKNANCIQARMPFDPNIQ